MKKTEKNVNFLDQDISEEEKKSIKNQIDQIKDKELEKMVINETTKQLNKYSNIFYNKIKLNSKIYEF